MRSEIGKQFGVARLAMSEAEIGRRPRRTCARIVSTKNRRTKSSGPSFRKLRIELNYERGFNPHGFNRGQALRKRFQQRGSLRGPQNARRVRIKREHGAHQLRLPRPLEDASKNFLVPEMHAVEVSDRERRALPAFAEVFCPSLGGM